MKTTFRDLFIANGFVEGKDYFKIKHNNQKDK